MDTKKFFQEIRKIIKEEISSALNEKLEEKADSTAKFKKEIEHGLKLQNEVKNAPLKENPSLTDLLNETRNSMVNGERALSFGQGDAQGFISNRGAMAQMLGYGTAPVRGSAPIPPTDIDGRPVIQLDPVVEKALTRDYSAVMKAIKEKKK